MTADAAGLARGTQRCSVPGCTGVIEDGYCDVCGTPAGAVPSVPARAARAPRPGRPGRRGGGAGRAGSTRSKLTSSSGRARQHPTRLGSRPGGSRTTRKVGTSVDPAARRAARRRTHHVPPRPAARPAAGRPGQPEVPEDQRFCPKCGAPVGRSRDGRPGRTEGSARSAGTRSRFTPEAEAGRPRRRPVRGGRLPGARRPRLDLPGPRPQRVRPLGGAQGPAQLRRPRRASRGDRRAASSSPRSSTRSSSRSTTSCIHEGAGYIVMEYVGGRSLKQTCQGADGRQGGRYDPLPVDQAIAYIIEILPAFSYLHDMGLLYCDFKPDNVIQVGDAVKLIDLGGVRRIDDLDSPIYGTVGYQAPEVPQVGPSVASDIYTLGRTLACSSMEFRGYQSHVRRLASAGRRHAAVPALRLVLPAAGQGVRPRPRRPVPDGRRAARAAARRPARDRRHADRRTAARPGTRRRRCCSRRPIVEADTARRGTSCRRSRSTPATRWRPGSRRLS